MEQPQRYNATVAVLTVAGLAYALQQTMVVPALPALQRDLDTTTGWATWVFTAFLLSASVATPILGKLGDQYGKERLLMICLLVFLVGCVGAAAAWDIWSLIGFRAVQGAAGAIFPLSFSIIRDEFPRERVGIAIGSISAVFGIGASVGLILSGLIVDHVSWRWIFIVGAIPVAIAAVLVHVYVPESPDKQRTGVDFLGAALLSGGLVCLLVALTEGQSWGWTSARVVGLFVAAALLLVAWGLAELRVSDPMVDMRMLANRPVLLTNTTALIAGFAMYSAFILVPAFVQTPSHLPDSVARLVDYGFGASATKAGLYLAPGAFLMLAAGPVAGVLGRRIGSKWPLAAGMLLLSLGTAMLSLFHDAPWQIVIAMIALSPGVALAFAAMSTLITQEVRASETGVANAMNAVLRTVGGVIGAQIAATILTLHHVAGTDVPAESGFTTAWALFAISSLVGCVTAVLVTPTIEPRREVAVDD
jgi:EmrB/QacA subfamily drug resistance transporter